MFKTKEDMERVLKAAGTGALCCFLDDLTIKINRLSKQRDVIQQEILRRNLPGRFGQQKGIGYTVEHSYTGEERLEGVE